MNNRNKFKLFIICLILLLKTGYVFSQPNCDMRYDSIKCIDINFTIIDYKLSLYNIAYSFLTKKGEYLTINKKCNYMTTGIPFSDRRTEKIFGFAKDSIYSFVLSSGKIYNQSDPLSYYSYVIFNKDAHTFDPKTFNSKKKIKNIPNTTVLFIDFVDIDDKIYSIKEVFPFHSAPDYLLPSRIYPFYKLTKKGDYIVNEKYKGANNYWRIIENDDGWFMQCK